MQQVASHAIPINDRLIAQVSVLLSSILGLQPGSIPARPETRVLGAIPELDSMSVMTFLISLEERFDIVIHDDEVDAAIFETLGSVTEFLQAKLA